jgi:hypothetical protein
VLEQKREGLGEGDCQKLQNLLRAYSYLADLIGEKDTTISQLRALLTKPSTEKTDKVLEQVGLKPSSKNHLPSRGVNTKPGHGTEAPSGIPVSHASLQPDHCQGA